MANKKIERATITANKDKVNIPSTTVKNNPKAGANMSTPCTNMSTPCTNMSTPCTSAKRGGAIKIKKS